MKKVTGMLLLAASVLIPSSGQGLISFLGQVKTCGGAADQIYAFTGGKFQCIGLGTGLSIVAGKLTITSSNIQWTIDTISLSSIAATATTVTFTPSKTPLTGALFFYYNTTNLMLSGISGAIPFTGQSVTFTLPPGWVPTETITIAYQ